VPCKTYIRAVRARVVSKLKLTLSSLTTNVSSTCSREPQSTRTWREQIFSNQPPLHDSREPRVSITLLRLIKELEEAQWTVTLTKPKRAMTGFPLKLFVQSLRLKKSIMER
jgi:hypothetical protein